MSLRTFWKKAAWSAQEQGPPQTADEAEAGREKVHYLSHISEFHLERLEKLLELRYQKGLSERTDTGLKALIDFASRIQDPNIQRELLLFYLNCSPSIQAFLRSGETLEPARLLRQAP